MAHKESSAISPSWVWEVNRTALKMLIASITLSLSMRQLPAEGWMDRPLEVSSPSQLKEEMASLKQSASKGAVKDFETYLAEKRTELVNDPFVPPSKIDEILVEQLNGKSPAELLEYEMARRLGANPYWRQREQAYSVSLEKLVAQQMRADETQELLQNVYLYNTQLVLEGGLKIDKAYVQFQFRNGTDRPIDFIRLTLMLHLPQDAPEPVIKQHPYYRLKKKVHPWETATLTYDILELLPDSIRYGPVSARKHINAELRLRNYKPVGEQWAIAEFPSHKVRELQKAREGLEQARLAQGKSRESETGLASAMMMN